MLRLLALILLPQRMPDQFDERRGGLRRRGWRERGATYRIRAKFRGRRLIRMADSAIRNGPR